MWGEKEREKFSELIVALSENYDMEFSDALVNMWLEVLQNFPFDDVRQAILEHMATDERKPKLASILKRLRGSVNNWDAELIAEKAFREALQAIERVGTYESIRFRDPIINAVIHELGGWERLGLLPVEGPEFAVYAREFKQLYMYYLKLGKVPRVDYLPGIHENNGAFPVVIEVGEPRNMHLSFVETENSVFLGEGRKISSLPKPKPRKALPTSKSEPSVSPEEAREYLEKLKALLSRVGKPMPGEKDAGVHNAN